MAYAVYGGKDLWKTYVLSYKRKRKGVVDNEYNDCMRNGLIVCTMIKTRLDVGLLFTGEQALINLL